MQVLCGCGSIKEVLLGLNKKGELACKYNESYGNFLICRREGKAMLFFLNFSSICQFCQTASRTSVVLTRK
jgi:hypothetical protein